MYRLPNAYDYSIPLIMKSTSPFVYTTPVESAPFSFCRMHPSSRRCRRSRIYLYCRPIPLGIQRTRSVYNVKDCSSESAAYGLPVTELDPLFAQELVYIIYAPRI